jgi:hypothetical protein
MGPPLALAPIDALILNSLRHHYLLPKHNAQVAHRKSTATFFPHAAPRSQDFSKNLRAAKATRIAVVSDRV